MLAVAGRSSAGAFKSVNQDSWCALVASTSLGDVALAVVCDGVGGLSSGELASSTAVTAFSTWFERDLPGLAASSLAHAGRMDLAAVADAWRTMLERLNRTIGDYGRAHGARLGTTVTALLVCQGRYVAGQVGDCRAYRVTGGVIEQLTEDQTLAARAVREGSVTKSEALRIPQGSVLLQSVGTQSQLRPEFSYGEIRSGDHVIVCCDGFYRRLGDEGIRAAYAEVTPGDEASLAATTERLIQQDMDQGERDNLTAVCLSFPAAADEPTSVLGSGADEPTAVFATPAGPASGPDDATALLTGDEGTSSLGEGDGPWRA